VDSVTEVHTAPIFIVNTNAYGQNNEKHTKSLPYLIITITKQQKKKTNSVALSPRANYTTATCRRNLVSTFVDRGVSRGQRGGSPTVANLSFQTGAATFLSSSSSFTLTRAEWTPFQTHCYSENLVAPGIDPDLWVSSQELRPLDHRGGQ
jgi:hypothetical protein